MFLLLFACTTDRDFEVDIITTPEDSTYELVHYWNFNDTSNLITPNQTSGGALMAYEGARFDDVDDSSLLNLRNNDLEGDALRLRNPSGNFIVNLPTTGFKDAIVTYAVKRSGSGAQKQTFSYTTDGNTFIQTGLENISYGVTEEYILRQFDFTNIPETDNNPNFKIKIEFDVSADGDTGNSRFDNFTLDAIPTENDKPTVTENPELFHYWNFNDDTDLVTLITPSIGNGTLEYNGASFDDVGGTDINARNMDTDGRALRLRNPSGEFIMNLPSTGYKNLLLKFAATRSGSGSQTIEITYTIDGTNYINTGINPTTYTVIEDYELRELDLSSITKVNNNPNFKVKITFDETSTTATSGNSRFDNLSLEGNTL